MSALLSLDHPKLIDRSGRGVEVVVIDSGVHAEHPHINGVVAGCSIEPDLSEGADFVDRLGHGTAVAAAIREKAPDAELYVIRVFDRSLSTTGEVLVRALERAIDRGADLVNLSLGTDRESRRAAMSAVVERAVSNGTTVISPAEHDGREWLPGSLPGVVGVDLDWSVSRQAVHVTDPGPERIRIGASGYPRPIPGVSPEHNLKGVSFAVANVTGVLARLLEGRQGVDLVATLAGLQ